MSDPVEHSGKIDLPALFESAASELTVAAEQGRLLHRTRNIRDSGAPLEARFRDFISARLPAPFRVTQGYLFGADGVCTPQIDALVIDERESHEIMKSTEGSSYVPYPSAYVVCEIKNSAVNALKHLEQIAKIATSVDAMGRPSLREPGGPVYHSPMTLLIIANSDDAKLSEFQEWFNSRPVAPNYTLLLDRGLLIASESEFLATERLGFYEYRSPGQWGIVGPKVGEEFQRGRTLMWLYFAIVAHLNLAGRGNMGTILSFTNDIERQYPMVRRTILSQAESW